MFKAGPGRYCFDLAVAVRNVQATAEWTGGGAWVAQAFVGHTNLSGCNSPAHQDAFVITKVPEGAEFDRAFYVNFN